MHFHIVTIFPEMFFSYLKESIIKKAIEEKKIKISFYNPKDFSEISNNPELKKPIDDRPFGGGPGMVLKAEPILFAIEKTIKKIEENFGENFKEKKDKDFKNILEKENFRSENFDIKNKKEIFKNEEKNFKNFEIIYFSPRGEKFNTEMAKKFAMFSEEDKILENYILNFKKKLKSKLEKIGEGKKKKKEREKEEKFFHNKINFIEKIILEKKQKGKIKNLILVSGRYEGIDSRVEEIFPGKRISIGDYILTGGELPAMILIDSISRQIFGVLGNANSLEEERISSGKFYTKPVILEWPKKEKKIANNKKNVKIKKYEVPKVLLSGNHKKIDEWKNNN